MSEEVNARSSLNEAFVMIRILELIPQHRWITMTQIRNQLAANGIPLQRRTLERYMKTIRENPQLFPIKANMDSRPYGYGRPRTSFSGARPPGNAPSAACR